MKTAGTENYGANFQPTAPNIALNLAADRTSAKFYYDHKTHCIADNVSNTIYTVPGSFHERARLPRRLAARLPAQSGSRTSTATACSRS